MVAVERSKKRYMKPSLLTFDKHHLILSPTPYCAHCVTNSMSKALKICNDDARKLVIHYAGLSHVTNTPCNQDTLLSIIESLGYVQLDPLCVVARAHDHILWSRNNQYRAEMLEQLLQGQQIFEHFSHDACVLPVKTLPFWKRQFKQQSEKRTSRQWRNDIKRQDKQHLLNRFKTEGALRSIDFKNTLQENNSMKAKPAWTKPEHKKLLDYLWLKGDLAVSKRHNFIKYYDLANRIYPAATENKTSKEQIHWLSINALIRLGFASHSEIMRFWDACSLSETKSWCNNNEEHLMQVQIESSDGSYKHALAYSNQLQTLLNVPEPTPRLRIINPFDPLVRDRKRLARMFGFDYKIEIYIPPKKRQYGYYVYPLLEYNRFIGRIELKHDRDTNSIVVDNLWPEKDIKFGKQRMTKLRGELQRIGRFCRADAIDMQAITA